MTSAETEDRSKSMQCTVDAKENINKCQTEGQPVGFVKKLRKSLQYGTFKKVDHLYLIALSIL